MAQTIAISKKSIHHQTSDKNERFKMGLRYSIVYPFT